MAQDPTEVVVPGQGHIYTAPAGTTPPTDNTTAPIAPWIEHGYTTEAGVTFSFGITTADIKAWQSLTPVRTQITERPTTVKFDLDQLSALNFLLAFGGGTIEKVTTPVAMSKYHPPAPETQDIRAVIVDIIDGALQLRFLMYRCLLHAAVQTQFHRADSANLPIELNVMANTPDTFNVLMPTGVRWDGTSTTGGLLSAMEGDAAEPDALLPT